VAVQATHPEPGQREQHLVQPVVVDLTADLHAVDLQVVDTGHPAQRVRRAGQLRRDRGAPQVTQLRGTAPQLREDGSGTHGDPDRIGVARQREGEPFVAQVGVVARMPLGALVWMAVKGLVQELDAFSRESTPAGNR